MSQKTEITFQIFQNINEIKKQLVSLGYEETEEFTGCDTYFTTLRSNEINSASYKDLLNSSIIIRSFKTKGKSELTNLMVFKNKILDNNNNVISEEKISTQISDLNSKIEEFQPIENDVVKLYSCGLTVYDHAHIGHARTTIFVDILVRLLRVLYNKVIYIRNITLK